MSEREEFEAWWLSEQVKTFPKNYEKDRLDNWGSSYKPAAWDAWQARAARTAPAEQAEPVAEMKGSYLYPLKSIPSGTKLYTAPDALQAEVSKDKLLRAQLETVRLQRDKELKEKCEALNHVERLKAELESMRDRKNSIVVLQAEVERLNKEADENTAEWGAVRLEIAEAKANAEEAIRLIREAWRLLPGEDTISHSVWHLAASEFLDAARTAKPEVKS